jgi:hypothetical protein
VGSLNPSSLVTGRPWRLRADLVGLDTQVLLLAEELGVNSLRISLVITAVEVLAEFAASCSTVPLLRFTSVQPHGFKNLPCLKRLSEGSMPACRCF